MWKSVLGLTSYRSFHTSLSYNANLGKLMKKVMGQNSKKKRIFSEPGVLPSAEAFSKGSFEGRYSGNARRVSVLNKLFMKYITDLLATGEYSSEFVGHGIEINRVQVSPDYTGLNIFWVAKGTQDDKTVEKILKKNAGYLRHELSSLRVIGNVPRINFVKDKQYSQLIEIDLKLAQADFGEDHVPTEMATKLKTQLELLTQLPPDVRNKIQNLDTETATTEDDEFLPPMPQNVLGLNHLDIMNRVKKSLKKSEAQHRLKNDDEKIELAVNENPIEFSSNRERREAFRKFLAERELIKFRARKVEKNYFPDIEYMKQEFEERRAEHFKNLDIYEENDFMEQDEVELVDEYHSK